MPRGAHADFQSARGELPGDHSRQSAKPNESDSGTVKLQKRLAEAGLGSRRAMEELIESGQVGVNGRVAKLGARVAPTDWITVAGKLIGRVRAGKVGEPQILLYHKPEGEIVSRDDPEGRPSVFDRVPMVKRGRWLAVGRLDFNTCGLLIFTDSGELANRLTHPRYSARRDYAVRIVGELSAEQIRSLKTGITLDDGPARFEVVEEQGGEGTNRWYRVRVREGRNRLVRRLFAAIGFTVSRLMRTAFGPFELPSRVKRGQWLRLDPSEVKQALIRLEREESGEARPVVERPLRRLAEAGPDRTRKPKPRASTSPRDTGPRSNDLRGNETRPKAQRAGATPGARPNRRPTEAHPGAARKPHRPPRRSPAR
jgi:23S rRNA pseudouridine2605 synthase